MGDRASSLILADGTVTGAVSCALQVLSMPLDADGEEVVHSGVESAISSPYMQYAQDDPEVRHPSD